MLNGGRIWLVVGAIIAVAVIAFGWLVGASPLLAQADTVDAQRRDAEAQNAQYEATLAHMKSLDDNKDAMLAEFDTLRTSVPTEVDLEGYFDWLAVAANDATVSLKSASVENLTPYEADADAIGIIEFGSLAETLRLGGVSISIEGDVDKVAAFLHAIQTDGRLQAISTVQVNLGTSLTATISGYIFVIDDPAFVALGASLVPAGPDDAAETDDESADGDDADAAPDGGETPAP